MKYADAWEELKDILEEERRGAESAQNDSEYQSRVYFTHRSRKVTCTYILALIEQLEQEYE